MNVESKQNSCKTLLKYVVVSLNYKFLMRFLAQALLCVYPFKKELPIKDVIPTFKAKLFCRYVRLRIYRDGENCGPQVA